MQQQPENILPFDEQRLIFLHGLESSGQGYKARLLRGLFPAMLTPDFTGSIDERMAQLAPILGTAPGWTIVGSSFGGLMGALWACAHPQQVRRLVLLAPALSRPAFAEHPPAPVQVSGAVYHGQHDTVVPLGPVRVLVEQVFPRLAFHAVDDDHMLRATVQAIDWWALLS
jgi:pimeloyl-ACP methyl ester carboxylesterase